MITTRLKKIHEICTREKQDGTQKKVYDKKMKGRDFKIGRKKVLLRIYIYNTTK